MTDKKEKELIEGCPWRMRQNYCKLLNAIGAPSPCTAPDCGPMYFARGENTVIEINGDDLKPELEKFMWEIMDKIQVKNSEALCEILSPHRKGGKITPAASGDEGESTTESEELARDRRQIRASEDSYEFLTGKCKGNTWCKVTTDEKDHPTEISNKLKKFRWDILDEIQDRASEAEFKALFGTEEEAKKASEAVAPHGIRLTVREFISLFDKDSLEKYVKELSEGIQDKAVEKKKTGEGCGKAFDKSEVEILAAWRRYQSFWEKGGPAPEKSMQGIFEKIQDRPSKDLEMIADFIKAEMLSRKVSEMMSPHRKNKGEGE